LQKIDSDEVKNVVVDLGRIPYFGSTLLDWFLQMWRRAKAKGGALAVCGASQIGQEVLQIAGFDKLWGIFDSRRAAVESFAKAAASGS